MNGATPADPGRAAVGRSVEAARLTRDVALRIEAQAWRDLSADLAEFWRSSGADRDRLRAAVRYDIAHWKHANAAHLIAWRDWMQAERRWTAGLTTPVLAS